jgi:hypothetical protein
MTESFIIQLNEKPVPKAKHVTVLDVSGDPVYSTHVPPGGAAEGAFPEYSKEIAEELRSICFVNKTRKTLTFKKDKTLARQYVHGLRSVLRQVSSALEKKKRNAHFSSSHSEIVRAIEEVGNTTCFLFYYQPKGDSLRCHTLSELILDRLGGRLPKKMYFGSLLGY